MSTRDRPPRPSSRSDFGIAIICALPLEVDAIQALFDHHWDDDGPPYDKAPGDANIYSTGAIGCHNVVLAHMPNMGNTTAAQVASSCRMSFTNVGLALVVGICGAAPFDPTGKEIILGDVIISNGVVQHDAGWHLPDGFKIRDTLQDILGLPNSDIRGVLAKLKTLRGAKQLVARIEDHLLDLQHDPELCAKYPGPGFDHLFEASYVHVDRDKSCRELSCNGNLVQRQRLNGDLDNVPPAVHIGTVASGNSVMRSGELRDRVASAESIVAFEMEASGVWDIFPCVMIKGVCDYADSHKNKAWQRYAAATAASCAKAFLNHWVPNRKDDHVSGPWFLVPYPRNENFVGREDILQKLRDTSLPSDWRPRLALSGLGGVGKTQIAIQHAYWLKDAHPSMSVFWVHASSAERFHQSFTAIAEACEIPGFTDPKQDVIQLVKAWLEKDACGPWLILIDNADDMELLFPDTTKNPGTVGLARQIPDSKHGIVFCTTRNKRLGSRFMRGKAPIEVEGMKPEEADELLQLASKTTHSDAADLSLLASRLDRLPLALAQAAAYIQENSITARAYLQLLEESDQAEVDMLSKEFETIGRDPDASRAVAETWMLSFQQMKEQNRLASKLLSVMSLLDRQAIPRGFLGYYATNLCKGEWTSRDLIEAEGTLKAYSFVTEEDGDCLSLHRLVQLVTQRWLLQRKRSRHYEKMVIFTVSNLYPVVDWDERIASHEYLAHGYAVLKLNNDPSVQTLLAKADLYERILHHLFFQGWYDDAGICGNESLKIRKGLQGPTHHQTLRTMRQLAEVYTGQAQWDKAEELHTMVLNACKLKYGDAHLVTSFAMSDLAHMFQLQCRYEEAEELMVEIVDDRRALLGETHIHTLASIEILAMTLHHQNRFAEAEKLQIQVLNAKRSQLGETHLETLKSMNDLATTYLGMERFEEAEGFCVQTVNIHRARFGETHMSTLAAMTSLAITYAVQGRLQEAEELELQVFEERRLRLGEDHPYIIPEKAILSLTEYLQGRTSEAVELLKECNRLQHLRFGPHSSYTRDLQDLLDRWKAEIEDN